jgi:DNA-binding FadR family transcriptional regulator
VSTAAAPAFQPIKLVPGYRAVCGVIEERIVRGELKAGTLLPTEAALAQQFGVNRSTIREAIRQLEQEGLVARQGARRLYVNLPGVHDIAPRAARALLLQHVTFEELWEVALVIEPQAAALAARSATPQDLVALHSLVERHADHYHSQGTMEEHAELDVAFHAQVARASANRVLMMAREPINLLYRPSLMRLQQRLPQTERRNLEAHRQIVAAIAARRADDAMEWMRKHLIDFQRGYVLAGISLQTPLQPQHFDTTKETSP